MYTSWNLEWLIASRRTWLSALGIELTSGTVTHRENKTEDPTDSRMDL